MPAAHIAEFHVERESTLSGPLVDPWRYEITYYAADGVPRKQSGHGRSYLDCLLLCISFAEQIERYGG